MDLPSRNFIDIVRDMSAAITASAGRLIDTSTGSVLRAIIEANAAIVLWVQWLVLLTLQTTRAATSTGTDLDSWMADFSLFRLPAATASGTLTLSRFSATVSAFVPVDMTIKTQDGAVGFAVKADPTNPAWQTTLNGYTLAPGVRSIDLPIVASVGGVSGNVLSNTITTIAFAVPGIDYASNEMPTRGGRDPESDLALRSRFANFLSSRSRATSDAIGYAIALVGADLKYVILENRDAAENVRPGNVLIIVDDGSGLLVDPMLTLLSLAVGAVRPVGTTFSIQPPQIVQVDVRLSVVLPPDVSISTTQSLLYASIGSYVGGLPIGGTLSVTRISQLAYKSEPRIVNISNVILNGQTEDIVAPLTTSFFFRDLRFT